MNKDYINSLSEKGLRIDGRKLDEYRKISIETGVSKNAEGSSRVKIGDTEVICGVKLDLGKPYPDSPDEGSIMVTAELSPLASPRFESGPPSAESIELARVVDRGIRESKSIDLKKLCLKKGESIWTVFIDIYPQNDSGNLLDASALAAAVALKAAKFPKIVKDQVQYGEFTTKSLPVKDIPIACTFGKINGKIILDMNNQEESSFDARLTVTTFNGNIHAMQKGGAKGFTIEEINSMVETAIKNEKEIRKLL